MEPLGLLTVAALLPRSWNLKLVDLDVQPLEDDQIRWADYVLIGGMIVHRASAAEVARRCRALERPVIAGGPLFATGHETFPDIEHFVVGEAEDLMPQLVADMTEGRVYAGMSIQFSRGCPFDCEFCDIVAMNGRVPRTKAPVQVIEELEALRRAGWKGLVFLVDDKAPPGSPGVLEVPGPFPGAPSPGVRHGGQPGHLRPPLPDGGKFPVGSVIVEATGGRGAAEGFELLQ